MSTMMCRYIDEGAVGSGMGLFRAEDSATKLKKGQQNVCTRYGVLFSPSAAEICARLAGSFLSLVDNSYVWGM